MIAACPSWPQYDDAVQDIRKDAGRPVQHLGQEPGFAVAQHTVPSPAQKIAETLATTAPETLIHGDAPCQGTMTADPRIGPGGPHPADGIYGADTADKGSDPMSTTERTRLLVGPRAPVAGGGSGGVTISAAWSQIAGLHALSSGAPVSIMIPSQDLRGTGDPIIAWTGRIARLVPVNLNPAIRPPRRHDATAGNGLTPPFLLTQWVKERISISPFLVASWRRGGDPSALSRVNSAQPEDTSSNILRSFDGKPYPARLTICEQGCPPRVLEGAGAKPPQQQLLLAGRSPQWPTGLGRSPASGIGPHGDLMLSAPAFHS